MSYKRNYLFGENTMTNKYGGGPLSVLQVLNMDDGVSVLGVPSIGYDLSEGPSI